MNFIIYPHPTHMRKLFVGGILFSCFLSICRVTYILLYLVWGYLITGWPLVTEWSRKFYFSSRSGKSWGILQNGQGNTKIVREKSENFLILTQNCLAVADTTVFYPFWVTENLIIFFLASFACLALIQINVHFIDSMPKNFKHFIFDQNN